MSIVVNLTNTQAVVDLLQTTSNAANMSTYASYSKSVIDNVLDNKAAFSNHDKRFVYRANNYIKQYLT